jgi:GalNAc5-diNAcBac-PP-undecaprenol beta-1,3-glucosyltransferase
MNPLLSIIIPTHNRSNLLRRSLNSILNQRKHLEIEIIVISDNLDLATDLVCHELLSNNDIYIRRNGVPGPAVSRNIGIKLSRANGLIFLDDDDELAPDFLNNVSKIQNLDEFKYFNFKIINELRDLEKEGLKINELNFKSKDIFSNEIYVKNQLPLSAFIFPNKKNNNIYFDAFMKAYEDWEFILNHLSYGLPNYVDINSANIYQVSSGFTDRRGSSDDANNFHAVLDYLYVYKRHPSINDEIGLKRANLLKVCGINISGDYL